MQYIRYIPFFLINRYLTYTRKYSRMWIDLNELNGANKDVYVVMGKSLRLCQNYETNFRHVMKMIQLEIGLKNNQIDKAFDEDWNNVVAKVEKWLIGKNYKKLNKLDVCSNNILIKLEDGRKSRNTITHNSREILLKSIRSNLLIEEEVDSLKKHVTHVAEADHIVSSWDWQLNEKDPAPISESTYVLRINNWIFPQQRLQANEQE